MWRQAALLFVLLLLACAVHGENEVKALQTTNDGEDVVTTIRFLGRVRDRIKRKWRKMKQGVRKARRRVKDAIRPMPSAVEIKTQKKTNTRYVALGDSYAAGVGSGGGAVPVIRGDIDRCCSRNNNAYPSFLARALGAQHFEFRACMGAVMLNNANSVARQMMHAGRNADLVTVTVGGNDMGFTNVAASCLISFVDSRQCYKAIGRAKRKIRFKIGRDARKLDRLLRRRFPKARIVFTGYPNPFARGGSRKTNKFCHPIRVQRDLNSLVDKLNNQLRRNVKNFVPVSFRGRELCNHQNPWFIDDLKRASRFSAPMCSFRRTVFRKIGGFYHVTSDGMRKYCSNVLRFVTSKANVLC